MRSHRQYKPDSLVLLFVLMTIGMILTSIAYAQDDVYRKYDSVLTDSRLSTYSETNLLYLSLPGEKNSLLLPGSTGLRSSKYEGMLHFQVYSNNTGRIPALLPKNSSFIISLGLEESERYYQSNSTKQLEWYDRYRPKIYFTLGHRW